MNRTTLPTPSPLGFLRGVAVAALAALVLASIPAVAAAQQPPFTGGVPDEGVALLLATQDVAPADLADALEVAGCDASSIALTQGGEWLIYVPGAPDFVNASFPSQVAEGSGFAVRCQAASTSTEATAEDAVALIETYFGLLDTGEYEAAYNLWRDGANDQSLDEFTAGYANTASVAVEVGEPGRIDAGAGQRYIEVPVTVTSTLDDGTEQAFEGAIVLHHTADIPGATDEQREWRIFEATLEQTN